MSSVKFASFGTPGGSCAAGFTAGKTCNDLASTSVAVVKSNCVGKPSCTITASVQEFGGTDPCLGVKKHLSVQVGCGPAPSSGHDLGSVQGSVRLCTLALWRMAGNPRCCAPLPTHHLPRARMGRACGKKQLNDAVGNI